MAILKQSARNDHTPTKTDRISVENINNRIDQAIPR